MTERYWVFRLSLLIAVLSLLLPSLAVAEDHRLLIDDDYGFFDGSTYFSDNRVNYCSQIDTVPERYSMASVWIEKREGMTVGDDVREDVVVVRSGSGAAVTCEPEIGNIFHQGRCSFGMSGATGEETFTFDDVCLTQDVVAECFPQYIAPTYWQYYNDRWRDFGDRRTKFAVPRYMYVQCPGDMKCRSGKCVDPSDPGAPAPDDYERRLPTGTFSPPRNFVVFGPGISRPEMGWRVGYSYDKVESYGPAAAPVKVAMLRQWSTSYDRNTEVRDHLGSNKLAAGVCTLRTSDDEVYLSPRYDKCTGVSNPNEIQECYLDAESGSINWVRVDCPAGTVCQDHAQGARCEVADLDADDDGDGYTPRRGDCRPDDAAVHPGAADDQCEDDIDNNCDGIINDACEADEYPTTCESRSLQYTGTPPDGLCCGDDDGETWNIGEGACYRETGMQVDAVTNLNILSGWSTDIEEAPTIRDGITPSPEEFVEPMILRARSAEYYSRADYAQHVGDPMVLELEYQNDVGGGLQYAVNFFYHDSATDAEGYGTLAWYVADMGPTEWIPLEESEGWTRIQLEFDYDIGSVSPANVRGILLKIRRLGRADSYVRNARIYPKGAERAVFIENNAYFCRATPDARTTAAVPVITYSETTSAHRSGSTVFPASNVRDACGVVEGPERNVYCDIDGTWKPTSSDTVQRAIAWIEVVGIPEIVLCYNERGEPIECPPREPPPPPPEPPHEIVSTMYGCCAAGACWSGSFCIENGGSTSSRSGTTMLCVAGEWQTEILKKDQYDHDAPTKACGSSQCFWNGASDLASSEDADDDCVDNEEFKEDYQCVFGSWRSRTSMVAQQMLHMTDLGERPDEYTLFCDEPERAVLNLEHSGPLAGIIRNAIYGTGDPADCGFGTGKPCVNNVCVLKFQQGGEEKVAVGMSLNKPIDVPHAEERGESILHFIPETVEHVSYVEAADHYTYCDGVVQRESPGWVYYGCDGPDNAIVGSPTELWYNPKTKSIIYSPQGVTVGRETAGTIIADALLNPLDTLFGAIRGWLGFEEREGIETDRSEVARRLKFDRLSIQRDDLQAIRGILQKDDIESGQDLMTVEYENIPADVCTNMNRICTEGENCKCGPTYIHKRAWIFPDWWRFMIKIKGAVGPEFADKWDDLTAKTRLDASVRAEGPSPDAPGIMHTVPTTTETPARFIIRDVPDEEDIIGYYWIFEWRDGEPIGKGGRTRREADGVSHLFAENGTYNVHLNVINKNFVVGQARTTVTVPTGEAELEPWARELLAEEEARLCRERGICPERIPPSGFGGP